MSKNLLFAALLALAGCGTPPEPVSKKECKFGESSLPTTNKHGDVVGSAYGYVCAGDIPEWSNVVPPPPGGKIETWNRIYTRE